MVVLDDHSEVELTFALSSRSMTEAITEADPKVGDRVSFLVDEKRITASGRVYHTFKVEVIK